MAKRDETSVRIAYLYISHYVLTRHILKSSARRRRLTDVVRKVRVACRCYTKTSVFMTTIVHYHHCILSLSPCYGIILLACT